MITYVVKSPHSATPRPDRHAVRAITGSTRRRCELSRSSGTEIPCGEGSPTWRPSPWDRRSARLPVPMQRTDWTCVVRVVRTMTWVDVPALDVSGESGAPVCFLHRFDAWAITRFPESRPNRSHLVGHDGNVVVGKAFAPSFLADKPKGQLSRPSRLNEQISEDDPAPTTHPRPTRQRGTPRQRIDRSHRPRRSLRRRRHRQHLQRGGRARTGRGTC